jgi:hypothetical protein
MEATENFQQLFQPIQWTNQWKLLSESDLPRLLIIRKNFHIIFRPIGTFQSHPSVWIFDQTCKINILAPLSPKV